MTHTLLAAALVAAPLTIVAITPGNVAAQEKPSPVVAPPAPPRPVTAPPVPPRNAYNPAVNRPASPITSPGTWIAPDDYPAHAIREEAAGRTAFRLEINGAGDVSACTILESSGFASLDTATCELLRRRARFEPALSNGQPTTGSYASAVNWIMPERGPIDAEASIAMDFVVDESGQITECTIDRMEGETPWGSLECFVGYDYLPIRDESGQPVARRVRIRYEVTYEPVE